MNKIRPITPDGLSVLNATQAIMKSLAFVLISSSIYLIQTSCGETAIF